MATAASSSHIISKTLIQQKFDVFISFRGIDTRDNIISHIYDRLHRSSIQTFIDIEFERGDDISTSFLRKIEESKISLIVFSQNYASSRRCLDELVKIMDCYDKDEQIVVPVFFKIDPSQVRKQLDTFGEALAQNEGHPNIQRWRNTLTKAANLSGWDSRVTTPEATLVTSIVTDILGKLFYTSASNFGDLVGMSSHFKQIESLLSRIHNEVRIIGLWGMGGIGKTTLARTFFNHNLSKFEGHYILENIREICERYGLNELREKLVLGILKDKNFNVGTPNLGIPFIRDILRRKKVLIVLDDVNDFQHIELLIGRRDSIGPGSIIIITSRDKQVLKNIVDDIYEVQGLDCNGSLCLFSRHAFKEEHPRDDHQVRLSNKVINYAKGHPLALKILGSHVFGKSKEEQESAMKKLEKTPNMVVQQVLLISYHGLDYQEKNLFLNIACLFQGESVNDVKCFHDSSNYYNYSTDIELGVLVDKSFITLSEDRVWMHHLVQEMGRQIVREESIEEPGKRSRLWEDGDICHVLTKNTGTEAIKGILLDSITIRQFSIHPAAFERMHNLEFLKIRDFSSILCLPHSLESLSNKLRYMYLGNYPFTNMPSNFHTESLVKLIMPHSHVERLWIGRQNLVQLKEIDLSNSKKLIEIPDLSLPANLETLKLSDCDRLKSLQVRNNSNLKYLCLAGCSLIDKFPEVTSKIQFLHLGRTAIEEIPSTISNLKSLVELALTSCKRLKNIPSSIFELKQLNTLGLFLPSNKKEHKQEEANMHLRELTNHLVERFSSLKRLAIHEGHFQEIPVTIKQLINLIELNVMDCRRLQSLPQLPKNVRYICAANCISLETVASPLSTSAGGVYDGDIIFQFPNCCKLDQDARNIVMADVETRLLHWKPTPLETLLQNTRAAYILFSGGDIPDWFEYKSLGSSLTAKLPPRWCNSELFCLVFGIAVEANEYIKSEFKKFYVVENDFHIKLNRGDSFSTGSCFKHLLRSKDIPQPNYVLLVYNQSLVNDWRRIYEEESNDAEEISIEFKPRFLENYTVKKCGFHLLYTRDIENRHRHSMCQPNSPCGDLTQFMDGVEESVKTQFSLKQDCVEDVEESMIQEDAKGNEGHNNDNSCNVGRAIEGWDPILRRRNRMKWRLNTFKFVKFLRVRRK